MYFMITLAKQRAFVGTNEMIFDSPSERVPEQFLAHTFFLIYNYMAIRHIFESVYKKVVVKYQYLPLWSFLAELGQTNLLFVYAMVGHWYQ